MAVPRRGMRTLLELEGKIGANRQERVRKPRIGQLVLSQTCSHG
jgi:hypothetical protein